MVDRTIENVGVAAIEPLLAHFPQPAPVPGFDEALSRASRAAEQDTRPSPQSTERESTPTGNVEPHDRNEGNCDPHANRPAANQDEVPAQSGNAPANCDDAPDAREEEDTEADAQSDIAAVTVAQTHDRQSPVRNTTEPSLTDEEPLAFHRTRRGANQDSTDTLAQKTGIVPTQVETASFIDANATEQPTPQKIHPTDAVPSSLKQVVAAKKSITKKEQAAGDEIQAKPETAPEPSDQLELATDAPNEKPLLAETTATSEDGSTKPSRSAGTIDVNQLPGGGSTQVETAEARVADATSALSTQEAAQAAIENFSADVAPSKSDAASAINPVSPTDPSPAVAASPSTAGPRIERLTRSPAAGETNLPTDHEAQRMRLVQRVARAFQSLGDGGGEVRLRLSPPTLGSLKLEVSVQAGVMNARIEADTQAAKSLLAESLPQLRERLASQDIKVARFDIELAADSQHNARHQHGPEEAPRGRPARLRADATGATPIIPAATSHRTTTASKLDVLI